MRVLICALALALAGCTEQKDYPGFDGTGLPQGVYKFKDGDVTCYRSSVYGGFSISCVAPVGNFCWR